MEGTEKRIEKRRHSFGLAEAIREQREKPVWQEPSRAGSYNTITRPAHYARFAIEPLDFIKANNFNFLVGNVIKYVCRYDAKNGLEDLRKAREYLDHIIAGWENGLVRDAGQEVGGQPASDDAKHGTDRRDGPQ